MKPPPSREYDSPKYRTNDTTYMHSPGAGIGFEFDNDGYDGRSGSGYDWNTTLGGRSSVMSGRQPYYDNSLKRKGVSWCDDPRARSHSPSTNAKQQNSRGMSHYGSAGNLSLRDRMSSPSYSTLGKHRDEYNRFETRRHAEREGSQKKDDESRFYGYGDRPGSGVELASHTWNGGEIISDPSQLPKSLKPRRFYYSPIGDGVVAADGIEKKRAPVDLSPRVTITQLTHVDRGSAGHDGLNVFEKNWTSTLASGTGSDGGFGSDYGGGSGRNSRATGALSPSGGDPYGKGKFGNGGIPDFGHGGPGNEHSGTPGSGFGGLGGASGPAGPAGYGSSGIGAPGNQRLGGLGGGEDPYGHGLGRPESGLGGTRGDPYGTLDSRGGNPYASNGNIGPDPTGRMSAASSMFSDPYRVVDTKTGYLITNPRELIHQYATTTPVAVMEDKDQTPVSSSKTSYKKFVSSTCQSTISTEEKEFAPYAPYRAVNGSISGGAARSPNNFVRQLRDETMTQSQREANTHLDALNNKDPNAPQRIQEIRQKAASRGHDEIDDLTNQLVQGLAPTTPISLRY